MTEAVKEFNQVYDRIIEETKSIDMVNRIFVVNAKLKNLLAEKFMEIHKLKSELPKQRMSSKSLDGIERNENILWDYMNGKKYKDLIKKYDLSNGAINKSLISAIHSILVLRHIKATPMQLVEKYHEELMKYFIVMKFKRTTNIKEN